MVAARRPLRLTPAPPAAAGTAARADAGNDGAVPEGDTVWLAAKRMHDALGGRPLTRFDLRVPALATTDLTGDDRHRGACRGASTC